MTRKMNTKWISKGQFWKGGKILWGDWECLKCGEEFIKQLSVITNNHCNPKTEWGEGRHSTGGEYTHIDSTWHSFEMFQLLSILDSFLYPFYFDWFLLQMIVILYHSDIRSCWVFGSVFGLLDVVIWEGKDLLVYAMQVVRGGLCLSLIWWLEILCPCP